MASTLDFRTPAWRMAGLLALALILAVPAADAQGQSAQPPAQQRPAAQPAPAQATPQAAPAQPDADAQVQAARGPAWKKICSEDAGTKKMVCATSQELRTKQGQLFASAGIRGFDDSAKKELVLILPLGVKLKPGAKLQIDKNKPLDLKYDYCEPRGCFAALEISPALLSQLKKGSRIVVQAINPADKPFGFPLALEGFTAAFDGPGVDLRQVAADRKKLEETLNKRAQEAGQRLLENDSGQGAQTN